MSKIISDRKKFILSFIFIVGWVGLWTWAGNSLPENIENTKSQNSETLNTCSKLTNDQEALRASISRLADEAKVLQRTLLKQRLKQIADEGSLTNNENKILSEYLAFDLRSLIDEKSNSLGEALRRNLELRPQVVKIINKLIQTGELKPYLFEDVQKLGQEIRATYQQSDELVKAHPDCFKLELDAQKIIDDAAQKFGNQLSDGNVWIAKKTADELVDSLT